MGFYRFKMNIISVRKHIVDTDIVKDVKCTRQSVIITCGHTIFRTRHYPRNNRMSNSNISFLNFRYYSNAISETNRPSYTPVFISNPAEYHKELNSKEYQIFVIDDIFGEACLNLSQVEQWRPHLEDIMVDVTANRPKTLVIVCVNKVCLIVLKKTGNSSFIWTAKIE